MGGMPSVHAICTTPLASEVAEVASTEPPPRSTLISKGSFATGLPPFVRRASSVRSDWLVASAGGAVTQVSAKADDGVSSSEPEHPNTTSAATHPEAKR